MFGWIILNTVHLWSYKDKDTKTTSLTHNNIFNTLVFMHIQGRSQNLKQVRQNSMKVFNVDDITLTS